MSELPEPLTPPGCDLRGFRRFTFDGPTVLESDTYLISTGDEFKAAFTLWVRSWTQIPAASLPDDDRLLARLSGAERAWKRVREVALRGWIKCADGRLYHPVIAAQALESLKFKVHQSKRAHLRWENDQQKKPQNQQPDDAGAYAFTMPIDSDSDIEESKKDSDPSDQRIADASATENRPADPPAKQAALALTPEPEAKPEDIRETLWRLGPPIIRELTGKGESACRRLLGSLLREANDDCNRLFASLQEARSLHPLMNAEAWLMAAARNIGNRGTASAQGGKSGWLIDEMRRQGFAVDPPGPQAAPPTIDGDDFA